MNQAYLNLHLGDITYTNSDKIFNTMFGSKEDFLKLPDIMNLCKAIKNFVRNETLVN